GGEVTLCVDRHEGHGVALAGHVEGAHGDRVVLLLDRRAEAEAAREERHPRRGRPDSGAGAEDSGSSPRGGDRRDAREQRESDHSDDERHAPPAHVRRVPPRPAPESQHRANCARWYPTWYVIDGSVFLRSGGYNPTLTIEALTWRAAERIARR